MKRYLSNRWVLSFVLLALFGMIHLYALDELPRGLHPDESGMAYDAWCLANYGVDRYLNPFPLYLINYGGGQSPMHAWLTAGLMALTQSNSTLLIRLPGAMFGLMTMAFGAAIVHELIGKKHPKAWFVFGIFYLIWPYFTMASRFGLDCNLMLGMSTAFLYTLVQAVKRDRIAWYALTGAAAGLTLYTYAISYLVMPLFLILALIYLVYMRMVKWKHVFALAIPLALIAWPLIAIQIINLFDLPEVTLFGTFTLPGLPDYRTEELGFGNLFNSLIVAIRNILLGDIYPYNTPGQFGTLYPISVPFVLIGAVTTLARFIRAIRLRQSDPIAFVLFWAVAMLFAGSLLCEGWPQPNINQMNGIFFATGACALLGIYTAVDWLRGKLRRIAIGAVACAYTTAAGMFFSWYFVERDMSFQFNGLSEEAVSFVENCEEFEGKTVHIATEYPYYLLITKTSPYVAGLGETVTYYPTYRNCDFQLTSFENALDVADVYLYDSCSPGLGEDLEADGRFQSIPIDGMTLYFDREIDLSESAGT